MKQYQGTTSELTSNPNKDLIYDLLEQNCYCASKFVHSVNFDDGIVSVVGTDEQFHDISRFCGRDVEEKSVLGVDPTFNLGDFYITPIVYENKLIVNKKTGKYLYGNSIDLRKQKIRELLLLCISVTKTLP